MIASKMKADEIEAFQAWLDGYETQATIVARRLRLGRFDLYACVKGPGVDVLAFDTGSSESSPWPLHVEPVLEACLGYLHLWLALPGDPYLEGRDGVEVWEGQVFEAVSLSAGSFIDLSANLLGASPTLLLIANRADEPKLSLKDTLEGLGSFIVSAYDDDGYVLGLSATPPAEPRRAD